MSSASKLKVFISYSRADAAFADELVAGLEFKGEFEVTIDRHSIIEGEDWTKRLGALIADADTVVFLLSPDSAQSQICGWEVEEAHRLSKRILPVLVRPIGSSPAPPRLAALNYVRFDESRSFMGGLTALVRALKLDVEWLREHTRLLTRANEWNDAKRPTNRLLSGADIGAAKDWLARRPKDAPAATPLHLDFIRASEQAEDDRLDAERRRLAEMAAAQSERAAALQEREAAVERLQTWTRRGMVGAALGTFGGAGLGYWGYDAERRVRAEQENTRKAAARAREEAIEKEASRTDLAGQLVAYAAAPGQAASDGRSGGNSPFTAALIESLADPSVSLLDAIAACNKRVLEMTGGEQRPYITSDLNGDVYLFRQPAHRRRVALTASVDGFPDLGWTLENVRRDSDAWASLLRKAGFHTASLLNPSLAALARALDSLDARAVPERRGGLDDRFVRKVGFRPVARPATDSASSSASASASASASVSATAGDGTKGLSRSASAPRTAVDSIAVVFYAGIGLTTNGLDYLGAKDTPAMRMRPENILPLRQALDSLRDRFRVSIVILDTNFNEFTASTRKL